MSDDYLWDRSGARDPEVARLEELLAPLAHDRPPMFDDELRTRRPRWIVIGIVTAAVAAAAIAIVMLRPPPSTPVEATGFDFVARGGTVFINTRATSTGTLATGDVLDTLSASVDLAIADIGRAELAPGTQVRLERSDATRRHLAIERGHLHARVNAPPRLFVVSTPAANVVDLGCEYTVDVGATGAGSIVVQHGRVELATRTGAIVVAPAGTHAAILPGNTPGLPLRELATDELERAVAAYLAGGSFDAVLASARPADAITVVNLAAIDANARSRALLRLVELSPPPPGVTRESALADPAQLSRWRDHIMFGD